MRRAVFSLALIVATCVFAALLVTRQVFAGDVVAVDGVAVDKVVADPVPFEPAAVAPLPDPAAPDPPTIVDPAASTQPVVSAPCSASATTRPASQLKQLLDDLDDSKASVREEARAAMLGMSRVEIATLRDVVLKNGPLTASQSNALHDIVVHAFLSSEPYFSENAGFLGVSLADDANGDIVSQPSVEFESDGELKAGVLVLRTMPGFCAFTALRAGDVVLEVAGPDPVPTKTQVDLMNAVKSLPPGRDVTLTVLRQGQTIKVHLRLSARPLGAARDALQQRVDSAEQYWQMQFVTLVGAGMS